MPSASSNASFISRALAKTNYNVCKAAKMTGLHRNTLSRKMASLQDQEDRVDPP